MKKLLGMLVVLIALLLAVSAGAEESMCECDKSNGVSYTHIPYDDRTHQKICYNCKGLLEYEEHCNVCTGDKTVCEECRATNIVVGEISHKTESLEWEIVDDMHQLVCTDCGTVKAGPGEHIAYCDEPGTCSLCKATGLGDNTHIRHLDEQFIVDDETCRYACNACGYIEEEAYPHYVYCDELGTCINCGTTGLAEGNGAILHIDGAYVTDDETCQYVCSACGYAEDPMYHVAWCDYPTQCCFCGESDVEIGKLYHEYSPYVNGGEMCQKICPTCQQVSWEGQHRLVCTDETNTCSNCNTANVTGRTYHPYEFVMVNDGTRHHQECSGCGVVFWSQEHQVLCTAEFPTICWVCHLEIGEDAQPVPQHIYVYENLGETHRATCEYCGKIVEAPHTASCINPTHCTECNADNVTVAEEQIQHDRDGSTTTHTEETHSFRCYNCDETITRPHEFDPNNLCQDCYYVRYTKLPGDADNNDKVTIDDAVAVLQKLANDSLYINEPNADVNADGTVDTQDLLLLMQYAAGWDVTLK